MQTLGARFRASWLDLALGALGMSSPIFLWWIGSRTTTFVPSIGEVFREIPQFLTGENIWPDVLVTIERVAGSLAFALLLGIGAAYVMHRGGLWGRVVDRYVGFMLGIPSTIAALLSLYIFKRSELGVYFVVSIITFPFVALTLLQGLRAADRRLNEMGDVYRLPAWQHFRHIAVPNLVPYTLAAVRNEYAHAWKVVVLAELFAVNSGMGARFARAFDRFRIVDAMLWLIIFMIILLSTEYLLLLPSERRVLRWRGSGKEAPA
jgi:NitT/TauT family transport system permease protein